MNTNATDSMDTPTLSASTPRPAVAHAAAAEPAITPLAAPPRGTPHVGAPYPANEAARLAALRAQHLLDSLPEQMFDDIVRVASNVCGTPIALISLVDENRQWFKAKLGLQVSETPRDQAFCAHAILEPHQPLVVSDATKDPRFASNPLVTGSPDIRLYAGAPIVSSSGHALGTVCVIDHQPRELTSQQIDSLQALSRQVSHLIDLRRVSRNSVDSVQMQLLAKSDKLRDVQRLNEQRGEQLDRAAGVAARAMNEDLPSILSSAQALVDRLDLRDPQARVHAQGIAESALRLRDRLGDLRAEIGAVRPLPL